MIHHFTPQRFGLILAVFSFIYLVATAHPAENRPATEPPTLQKLNISTNESENETSSNITWVMEGFEVQHLYDVPLSQQGSWVSLAVDPDGYLIASDQQNHGTYRIKVIEGENGEGPSVEVVPLVMPISGAFGLLWAFDHLYANRNGVGLFRLRDENRDGQLNLMEFLGGPVYRGEHGNHTIIKTADGEGLYYVAGNHVPPPSQLSRNRVVTWDEDLLLPREWDARGHARGVLAPGGYIARINQEATEWDMVSIGYRNQYDAALNEHGELFTYDSDMEWDMGMPWYRPTRIVHVVSGSDYGWRSGSGKWPEYFEDSLPPMLNVGPGSPTGLEFGTGARFPAKYQRAMYAFDWTFGTIYAVHLTPDGPTYKAEAEEFLTGSPLPVTSGTIGKDGALYFVTGGRNQDSQLYRVIYTGNESTDPAEPVDDPDSRQARELRHNLEAFHGIEHIDAIETAWPYLSSEDRIIRNAARLAVESQPVSSWSERALSEEDPQARITSVVALARNAPEEYRPAAIQSLLELNPEELSADQKLGYLRAMSLIFMRLGEPDEPERSQVGDALNGLLPDNDERVNTELIRVMVFLRDSRVIEPALALIREEQPPRAPDWSSSLLERNLDYGGVIKEMIESPPPTTELGYAFMLRTLRDGWTIEQRREYFTFINQAADRFGGRSYSGFLEDMRAEALRNSTNEEREAVADITGVSLAQQPDFEIKPAEGPGRDWTLNEAMQILSGQLSSGSNRDYERGRNAFFVTSCAACHRFDNYGGDIGPDLSSVNRRFSTRGLVEKIIDPNILISDQYSSSVVTLRDGSTITGLVVERGENLEIYTRDPSAEPTVVSSEEVRSVEHSSISQMPPGLINPLNEDELRDLIAYIISGGNPDHEMFMSEEELEEAREAAEREAENEQADDED
ncbi:MAG: c-type cytochrome [Balneolaceae bacterium]|nr:c-type cytochrome [Balneolaceae bacterium]